VSTAARRREGARARPERSGPPSPATNLLREGTATESKLDCFVRYFSLLCGLLIELKSLTCVSLSAVARKMCG